MRLYGLILIVVSIFFAAGAFGQPRNIHLSWTGQHETNTSHTMAITWNSKMPNNKMVRYGLKNDKLNSLATAAVNAKSDLKGAYIYKAELSNLRDGTTYYYQCGSDLEGWSNVYSFKTAPKTGKRGKYVVGVWGDTQNNKGNLDFEETSKIVQKMAQHKFNLIAHMGDIVENGSVVKSWDAFLNTTQPLNAQIPFMPVTGNHDVVNANQDTAFQKPFPIYYDLFNLPGDYINYSYDYGNIHFVAINSGYAAGAAKVNKLLYEKGSPEYNWLNDDLTKARKNKKIEWIILYAHYPMYAYGVSLVPQWQKNVTPLIDKYNIDLCLTGHRHVYERHAAIKNDQIFKSADKHIYQKPAGTVYITNGSAGGSLQGIGGKDMPSMVFTPSEKMYTYAVMTIENNQLSYEVFNNEGLMIDHFKIIK